MIGAIVVGCNHRHVQVALTAAGRKPRVQGLLDLVNRVIRVELDELNVSHELVLLPGIRQAPLPVVRLQLRRQARFWEGSRLAVRLALRPEAYPPERYRCRPRGALPAVAWGRSNRTRSLGDRARTGPKASCSRDL